MTGVDRRCARLTMEQMRRLIPKDEATQRLIGHFAEEIYNSRIYFKREGDNLSDWIEAENRYVRIFLKRRITDCDTDL